MEQSAKANASKASTADNIFVDGGCGYNFMMAHLAQVTGCKTYGIEYVCNKVFLGMQLVIEAIQQGELDNYNIGYVPWDVFVGVVGPSDNCLFL
jgi:hypothetical protein